MDLRPKVDLGASQQIILSSCVKTTAVIHKESKVWNPRRSLTRAATSNVPKSTTEALYFEAAGLRPNTHQHPLQGLLTELWPHSWRFWLSGCEVGIENCISNTFPGDADTAGLGDTVENEFLKEIGRRCHGERGVEEHRQQQCPLPDACKLHSLSKSVSSSVKWDWSEE